MDNSYTLVTASAEDTQKLGKTFGRTVLKEKQQKTARVVCLWGDLGSGKTTFVQGVAQGLGIQSRLLSPTFIIVRRYIFFHNLMQMYHVDLYRLKEGFNPEELGIPEIFRYPDTLCFIEWPERMEANLPKYRVNIRFRTLPDGKHQITIG